MARLKEGRQIRRSYLEPWRITTPLTSKPTGNETQPSEYTSNTKLTSLKDSRLLKVHLKLQIWNLRITWCSYFSLLGPRPVPLTVMAVKCKTMWIRITRSSWAHPSSSVTIFCSLIPQMSQDSKNIRRICITLECLVARASRRRK